jgi:hypothetical protein
MCGLIDGFPKPWVESPSVKRMVQQQKWLATSWSPMAERGTNKHWDRTFLLLMPRRCITFLWAEVETTFGHGLYTVRSAYHILAEKEVQERDFRYGRPTHSVDNNNPIWRKIWSKKFPKGSGLLVACLTCTT